MASSNDRNRQSKESSPAPAPLLLMQATSGLSFNNEGSSLFMPVVQAEASLITSDEDGEADNFLGQSPPSQFPPQQMPCQTQSPGSPANLPQMPPPSGPGFSTPSGITRPGSGIPGPNPMNPPPGNMATPPKIGGAKNYHRLSGRPQYAQPPAGTYATDGSVQSAPFVGSSAHDGNVVNFSAPPSSSGPPTSFGAQPTSFGASPSNLGAFLTNIGAPPTNFGAPPTSFAPPPSTFGAPPTNIGSPPNNIEASRSNFGPNSPNMGAPPMNSSTYSARSPGSMGPTHMYVPVQQHWFYSKNIELQQIWKPFSVIDSIKLEDSFRSVAEDNVIVSTDGGRYDVDLIERTRTAIYWDENPTQVRRASWFYRPEGDSRVVPYEEDLAEKLEDIFKETVKTGEWHRRHEFPGGDVIVMHSPNVFVSFKAASAPDEWGTTQSDSRPIVVKRGIDEIEGIAEGEPNQIDHLVFVVHGIGPTCDLRFRNIIECVDDFRNMSIQICRSHYNRYQQDGSVGRVEFLPVRWHQALHGDATGVDRRLKAITLNSIGKLRHYTNDTLLDILFYTSPTYAQQIADTVGCELNRLYKLFMDHNPSFSGGFSIAGHSLGSLILFDLLTHQFDGNAPEEKSDSSTTIPAVSSQASLQESDTLSGEQSNDLSLNEGEDDLENLDDLLTKLGLTDYKGKFEKEEMDLETLSMCEDSDIKEMGIPLGPRKKIQGYLKKLSARRKIAEEREQMMATKALQEASASESNDIISSDTPWLHDPLLRSASQTSVNYMMGVSGTGIPFVQYPQLKFSPSNFFALGSPISMFLTVRGVDMLGEEFHFPTCPGFFNVFHPFDPVAYRLEPMITPYFPPKPYLVPHHKGRKRMHLELKENLARMGSDLKHKMVSYFRTTWKTINDFALAHRSNPQDALEQEMNTVISEMSQMDSDAAETESIVSVQEEEVHIGSLNQGRRIDCVLQEKPIESFNDYLFALGSHACYWESEDTVLLILKEIYSAHGILPIRPGQNNIIPPVRANDSMTAFPRHPMASSPVLSPSMPPRTSPSGGDWSHPDGATPGRVAPPPLAGFVRK